MPKKPCRPPKATKSMGYRPERGEPYRASLPGGIPEKLLRQPFGRSPPGLPGGTERDSRDLPLVASPHPSFPARLTKSQTPRTPSPRPLPEMGADRGIARPVTVNQRACPGPPVLAAGPPEAGPLFLPGPGCYRPDPPRPGKRDSAASLPATPRRQLSSRGIGFRVHR
jgi:hypothetical protein